MSEFNKYLSLLDAILNNAINLKQAGRELLVSGVKNKNLLPFAKFMFYTSIEECGKFLLVRDSYPNKLTKNKLNKIGFYDHNKKIERLVRNINKYELHFNRNTKIIAQIIRNNLRESGLYIGFDGANLIMPFFVNNKNSLNSLVSLTNNSIKYCKCELETFKKNPFN